MALFYNIETKLALTGMNADVDATITNLPSDDIDMAFFAVGNWLTGNYVQKGATINDIRSNVNVDATGLNKAHFFIAPADEGITSADLPSGDWTAFANATGYSGLPFGSAAINTLAGDTPITWGTTLTGGTAFNYQELIPAVDTSLNAHNTDIVDSGVLQEDGTTVGSALFQSVAVALFNKVGKNAAISNDTDLVNDLGNELYNKINEQMAENSNDYSNTKLFGLYLDQGRYRNDIEANADLAYSCTNSTGSNPTNTVIDYDLNNTIVNMIIVLSGVVNDVDGSFPGANMEVIFGDANAASPPTKVQNDDRSYTMNIFLSLKQDDRF